MGFFDRFRKKNEKKGPPSTTKQRVIEEALSFNPTLTSAVEALSKDDTPETRRAVHDELLKRTLVIPSLGNEKQLDDGGKGVQLQGMRLPDGRTAAIVFTDPYTLQLDTGGGNMRTYIMASQILFEHVYSSEADVMIINPSGPFGLIITKDELSFLARGLSPYAI